MAKIGFIGIGNMGYAILSSLVKCDKRDVADVFFTDVNAEKCKEVEEVTSATYIKSNKELVEVSDFVVLAVKPQFLDGVLNEVKEVSNGKIILSIVAGVTVEHIKEILGDVRVVRSMPNTPAMVGAGMTGVAYEEAIFTKDEIEVIDTFYSSYGRYERVPEKLMNVVTCACGSSPAYVYMFIEALADSVVKYGMPRDTAYTLVAQTVMGSAKMVMESGEHPAVLKDKVCSPGGTTIAGVAALEEAGFRNAIIKATDACFEVGENLSKKK